MAEQEYTLDLLEQLLIHTRVANERPVIDTPKGWRNATAVLEKLAECEKAIAEILGEKPLKELHGENMVTVSLSLAEAKFIVQQLLLQWNRDPKIGNLTLEKRPWLGGQLVFLVPLWDKLYPDEWEEITPEKPGGD